MSSYYAGVRAIGAIPGMVSIHDNDKHIELDSGVVPRVTMTKQIALMLHDNKPHSFVIEQTGVRKFRPLAEMVARQVVTCLRIDNSVDVPPPRPPPQLPVPTSGPPPPPQLPVPTSDPPPQVPTLEPSRPVYDTQILRVGEDGKHLIKVYIPSATPAANTRRKVVLYLSSTTCEEAPIYDFQGSEVVCAPQFENSGRAAWRNEVPDWLVNWAIEAQAADNSRWSLFGFSRGACWGAAIAADVRLHFHRVALVAPYILPRWSEEQTSQLCVRLRQKGNNLCIAFGSRDHWQPCSVVQLIQEACASLVFEGLDHQESLRAGVQALWHGLFFEPIE